MLMGILRFGRRRPKDTIRSPPGTGVTDGCELPDVGVGNGTLEEQLLATELPLQASPLPP